ncbi:MAG: acetylornithine transaminase [Desulfobacterales bacterium]|nr:acetylornithine transaminase [Desulfobacterales bacterium]
MDTDKLIQTANSGLLSIVARPEIVMARGRGLVLEDTRGRSYLDFIGGWAVNCLGHCPEALVKALTDQAGTLINASPSFYNRPMLEYTELLLEQTCLDRVFFTSTGAEANEGAIKLARKYGQKKKGGACEIITTRKGFHGRTLTTMAATGKAEWEDLFEPKSKGFKKGIFNDAGSIRELITDETCAIMIEPVQGEGGVIPATEAFIRALRQICDETLTLLIFDEIQTGMGRTGTMFAYEQYGVEPDIMTLGKGIGGGFPLSAMLAKEELDIFDPGDQGGTYTGQPLAMAAGSAVLRELLARDIPAHARKMGKIIENRLTRLSRTHEVENIRGKGLLMAFDLTRTPAADLAERCLEDGLLINAPKPESIRLMPPLTVTEEQILTMFDILTPHLAER